MKNNKALKFLREYNVVVITALVFLAAVIIASPKFTKLSNLSNLAMSIGTYGILAIGLTFVFIVGGIDLSIGYQVAFCGTMLVIIANAIGLVPALIIVLLMGTAIGYLNGTIVTRLKIPPLIGTLAVMTALNGLVLLLSNNSGNLSIKDTMFGVSLPEFYRFQLFGVLSPSIIIALVLFVGFALFLKYTRSGSDMYVTGGNPEAGAFSGINNGRLTRIAYSICGLCSAICSFLLVSSLGASTYNMGDGLDITAICAVVIGGVKMQGGKGNMGMCLMGVATMQIINNAMIKMGLHGSMQSLVTGIVVILVLILDKLTSKKAVNE